MKLTEVNSQSLKKYKIIYADPPWSYKDKAAAGKRGAGFKYSLMSEKDIQELKVSEIADKDCVLFLWCTFPLLQRGLDTIKAWGFEYKTVAFNWVKTNKKQTDTFFMGMGNWTRSNSEVCLLAVKGKPKRVAKNIRSIIKSPLERHSQKPSEVRDRIVELCGDVERIELFARTSTEGWDVFGNEV